LTDFLKILNFSIQFIRIRYIAPLMMVLMILWILWRALPFDVGLGLGL